MVPLPPNATSAISSTAPAASPAAASAAPAAAATSNGLVVALIGSVNSIWALWKKKPNRSTKTKKTGENSSLAKSKKFLAKISGKATNFMRKKKSKNGGAENGEDFGDGGLWQKEILMGDKCQPLDFSGVIYYDRNGNQLAEGPVRSARSSPLPFYVTGSSKHPEIN
ncbi:uncharacterized protein LOC107022995 [Solanum pennellii]|uniref:Uncharacterized protein LOC107022995 n=1 Tax=Solanum pennellii TaxID=28526 RepID=A0ABM1H1G8_SOLPN|nr:uncharacterized protein LOC107022995 [Solanum pennellii]